MWINIFLIISLFKNVMSLSEVETKCVNSHQNEFSNDFLLGTWYIVYKFSLFLNLVPTTTCEEIVIVKPTQLQIQNYTKAYPLKNPYSFDDNPVLLKEDGIQAIGMMMGDTEAKFFIYDPKDYYYKEDIYDARVYKRVNDDYILMHHCSMRGFTKWLMSRKRNPSDEELKNVIDSMKKDVGHLQTQKYCSEK